MIAAIKKLQTEIKVIFFSTENKSGIIDSLFHELNIDGFVKKKDTTQKSLKKPSKPFRMVKNIFL